MGNSNRTRKKKGGMKTFGRFVENSVNSGLNLTRKVGNKGLDAAKSVGQSVVALPLIASKGAVAMGKVVSQAVGKVVYASYQEIWRLINDQILGQQIIHERILINRHYGLFFSNSFNELLKPKTLTGGASSLPNTSDLYTGIPETFVGEQRDAATKKELSETQTQGKISLYTRFTNLFKREEGTSDSTKEVEIEEIQNAENNGIIDKIANIPFEDNDLFEIFSLFKTGMGKMYTYGYTSIKARRIHSTDIELLFGSVEKIGKGPLLRQIQQEQIKEKWTIIEKQKDEVDQKEAAVNNATAVNVANADEYSNMTGGSAASSPPKYLNILYKLNKYFDLDDLITSNPRLGKFSPYFQKREAAKILLRAIYMFLSKYNPQSDDVLFTRDEIHEYTVVDVKDIIPKVQEFITKNKGTNGHIFPDDFVFDLKEAYAILNDETYYGTTYSKHKTELDDFLIKNGNFIKNNSDKVKSGSLSKKEYIDAEKALDDVCLNPGELSLNAKEYNDKQNEQKDSLVLKRLILKLSLFLYYFMLNRPFDNTVWTEEIKFINDYSVKKNESLYFGSELSSKGDTFSGFVVKQEMMEFGSKTKYSALEGLFYSSRKTVVLERIVKFLGEGKKQDLYLLFLNLLLDNYRGYMESPKSYRVVSFKKLYSYGLHLIYDYLRNINQEKYVLPSSAKLDELQQRYNTKKGEYEIRKQDTGIVNQILDGIKDSVMAVFDNILKQQYNPLPSTSPSTSPTDQPKNPPITNIKKFYYSQDQRLDVLFSLISSNSTDNNKIRIVCGKSVLDSFFEIYKDDNQIKNSDKNQIKFPNDKLSTMCFSMGGKTVEVMVEAHEGSNKGKEKRLTLYGILEALVSGIKIESSIDNQEKGPRQVFVSPELQHWMTAVCLFLSSQQTSLQLIVSPFLYNPENKVDSLTTQIDKFRIFLEFIVSLIYIFTDNKKSTTISGGTVNTEQTETPALETVVETPAPETVVETPAPKPVVGKKEMLEVVKKIKEVSIQIQVQKDVYNFSFDPIQNKIVMRKNSVQKDFFESLPRKAIQLTNVITQPIFINTDYEKFYIIKDDTNPSYYEQDMVADKFRIETADKIDDDDILSVGFKNFVKRRMGFRSDLQVHGMVYRNHSFVDFFQKDVVVGIVGGPVRKYEYALDYLKREKTFYFLNDLANVPFENNEFFEIFSLSKTIFSRKLAYMRTSNNIVELSNLLTASIMATLIPLQCVERMHNKMAWLFSKPLPKEMKDNTDEKGNIDNEQTPDSFKTEAIANNKTGSEVNTNVKGPLSGGSSSRFAAFQGWEILILSKINKFLDINDVLYGDNYGYFSPFFHKREACIIVLKAIHSFLPIRTSSADPVSKKSLEETVKELTKSIPIITNLVSELYIYETIIKKNNSQVSEKLKNDPTPRDKMDGTKTPMEMEPAMKDIRQTLYSLVQILASVIDKGVVPQDIKKDNFDTNSGIYTRLKIRAQNATKYTFSGQKERQLENIIFESCKQMVEDKCKKVVDLCKKDKTKKEEWMNFIHAMYKSTILAPHFICGSLISNAVGLFLQGVFLSMGVVDITLAANTAANAALMPAICLYSMAFTSEFLKKIWIFFMYERTNILKIDYTRNYDRELLGEIFKNLNNESAFPTTKYNVFYENENRIPNQNLETKQQVQYYSILQHKDNNKEFLVQEVGKQEQHNVGSIDTFTDFNLTNHPDKFFKLKFMKDETLYVVRHNNGKKIIAIYNFDDFEKNFQENIEYKTVPSAAPSEVPSAAPSAAPLTVPLTAPLDPTSQQNADDIDNEITDLTNVNKNRNYFVYYKGEYRECNLIVKNEYNDNNTYKFGIKTDASNYKTIEITTDKQNNINNNEYKLFYDKPSDGMQPASPVGPVQPVSITQIQTKPPVPRTVSNDLQEMLELKPKGPWKYNDENVGSFQGAYNSEDDNNNIVYQFQNKEFSFPIGQEKNEITKFTRPPYDGEDLIIFINKNVSTKIKSLVFIMKDYNEAVDASLNNLSDKAKILRILLTTPEQNVKEPKIAKQFFEIKDEVLETDTLLKKIQNFKEPLPPAGSFVYDLLYVISLIFFGAS